MINNQIYNPFSLEGKTILVTGASSGIGRRTAIECSKMGAKLIVVGRDQERLNDTFSSLEGEGHTSFVMDLAKEDSWQDVLPNVSVLDGIANCAGIANMNPFLFISRKELEKVFDINFFGPVLFTKTLIKAKKLNNGGSVVFVSSVDGTRIVHSGNSVYSAGKSAIVGMSRNMALELAKKNIRVNCVLPGTTDTPMIRTANVTEESLAEVAKSFPLRRFGTPEDMAYGIIYLLSDASRFVTGIELVIDGGYTLQ